MTERFSLTLDHLVVAAPSLEAGCAWLEPRLGALLAGGGAHPGWGTHNRLLQLGRGTYLELIAPDPGQAQPARPRPFGLDRAEVQARIAERPRLLHFVMRCSGLDALRADAGYDPGPVQSMSRGDLRWRITVPADGVPAGEGLLPTLIEWNLDFDTQHPSSVLPPAGVTLESLEIGAPDHTGATLARLLSAHAAADQPIVLSQSAAPTLRARLRTFWGTLLLD